MAVIVYIDETGDHSLEKVDRDFPLFAVALLICDEDIYCQQIAPAIYKLKIDFFQHEAVILHSRDIRKRKGDFKILSDRARREEFYTRLDQIMSDYDYSIISTVIRKQKHRDRYGVFARNPYDLALKFSLERLLPLLENLGQEKVQLMAESRGKKEDDELKLSFLDVVNQGTEYIGPARFKAIDFKLNFVRKERNVIGTQLADLVAYPIARHVFNPSKPNPAYEIVKRKLYQGPGFVRGLKIFP